MRYLITGGGFPGSNLTHEVLMRGPYKVAVTPQIAVYLDVDDWIDKVKYYLAYEDEREAIAERGYQRTLLEHTYRQRFQPVLAQMGFNV